MNKYKYMLIIQQRYTNYWEDVDQYPVHEGKECRRVYNEYRLMGYPTRIINRRVLNK